jgi:hypothetical protein
MSMSVSVLRTCLPPCALLTPPIQVIAKKPKSLLTEKIIIFNSLDKALQHVDESDVNIK